MIVTCPNCNCQFKVSLAVFGREGRTVRCSACKEEWWQEPTLDDVVGDVAEEIKQDQESIPELDSQGQGEDAAELEEALVSEEIFVKSTQERVEEFKIEQGRMTSYYIAAGLFFIILVFLLMTSSSMMRAYPSMQGFYKFFGMEIDLPDTMSIMFEDVKAEREGTTVTASGRIVNLSRREWALPMIEVVVFKPVVGVEDDEHEEIIAQWVETPPEAVLGAEQEIPFSYTRYISFGEKMQDSESHGEADEKEETFMVRVHFVVRPDIEPEMKEEKASDEAEEHGSADETEGHETEQGH